MNSRVGDHKVSSLRDADAMHQVLESGIAAQGFESGIHPDPWDSSRALQEGLLQRLQSFFVFTQFGRLAQRFILCTTTPEDSPAFAIFKGWDFYSLRYECLLRTYLSSARSGPFTSTGPRSP